MKKRTIKLLLGFIVCIFSFFVCFGCSNVKSSPLFLSINYTVGEETVEQLAISYDERGGDNTFVCEKEITSISGAKLPFSIEVGSAEYGTILESVSATCLNAKEWGIVFGVEIKENGKWIVLSENEMPSVTQSGEYRIVAKYKNQYAEDFYKKHPKEELRYEAVYAELYFTLQVVGA